MKQCNVENCSYPVFSKGKCKFHMDKKPIKKRSTPLLSKRKTPSPNRMREFFLSIWRKRPHRSEISGQPLGKEPLSTYFHHIIEKSHILYGKQAIYDEENIILLTAEEHETVHKDIYKYSLINKKRKGLIERYEKSRNYEKTI